MSLTKRFEIQNQKFYKSSISVLYTPTFKQIII